MAPRAPAPGLGAQKVKGQEESGRGRPRQRNQEEAGGTGRKVVNRDGKISWDKKERVSEESPRAPHSDEFLLPSRAGGRGAEAKATLLHSRESAHLHLHQKPGGRAGASGLCWTVRTRRAAVRPGPRPQTHLRALVSLVDEPPQVKDHVPG